MTALNYIRTLGLPMLATLGALLIADNIMAGWAACYTGEVECRANGYATALSPFGSSPSVSPVPVSIAFAGEQ